MMKENRNVIVIGNFDGFHLGHKEIVRNAVKIATKENSDLILLTFDPNPKVFFGIESELIFNCKEKAEYLKREKINFMECLDFNKIFNMDGILFIENFLIKKYKMKYLIVGENFKLGKGKEWDVKKIRSIQSKYGFNIIVIPSVYINDIKISSSKIREFLRNGDINNANLMLGHRYCISGIVERGENIGTKLGYPTINIPVKRRILPNGVYETETEVNNVFYKSITYIGNTPTFGKNRSKIETHILSFKGELYDKEVKIYFLKSIRGEKKFKTKKELITQIALDIKGIHIDK